MKKIQRAIISTSKKEGLLEFAKVLSSFDIEIYSTGGTLRALVEGGIEAKSIESYTEFPEMLDGRVKTLHPKIHGGILAIRDNKVHQESLRVQKILTFDLVVINLYPFEDVIQRDEFSFEEAIENIDIGGPTMIRAAAKNYNDVAVVVEPSQYQDLSERLQENEGSLSREYRFELAVTAFNHTASYDSIISQYLNHLQGYHLPLIENLTMKKIQEMRYGENPHQAASFYAPTLSLNLPWKQLHGKELSYNNLLDIDIALKVGFDFKKSVCAIFKHTNPCGIGAGKSQKENLLAAIATDPVSFFGGIAVFNEPLQAEVAAEISKHFFEIVIAPSFDTEAFSILSKKKNLRIIEVPRMAELSSVPYDIRSAAFGYLLQENDKKVVSESDLQIVSKAQPSQEDIDELLFSFQVVKYIKSNAIVFCKDGHTLGVGAGQMSRVDSIRFAIEKAKIAGLSLQGSYLASDAYFPFKDGVELAIETGVRAVIQPGGSIRDQESIDASDKAGIIMAMSGFRHFRH